MRTTTLAFAALIACSSHLPQALAQTQSACSSDGQPQPLALVERFISADCEACWSDPAHPTPSAQANVVTLDWIVPGTLGDDAPLSAAATRDALQRLDTLARPVPTRTDVHIATVQKPPTNAAAHTTAQLRVGHGPPFNDYLGATMAFQPAPGMAARGPWSFYLLLVESVPAGADGTTAPRNLVRNMLQGTWGKREQLSKSEKHRWSELRPMRFADGAQPARLRMVGWVQDAQGRIVAAAQSVCPP